MRKIDVHAHYIPPSVVNAEAGGEDWYGLVYSDRTGPGFDDPNGRRVVINSPSFDLRRQNGWPTWTPAAPTFRCVDPHPFFGYSWDSVQTQEMAREVNDAIAELVRQHPQKFAGMATLPAQDVAASIDELERAVQVLGLKGAELDAVVNAENWDEPRFCRCSKPPRRWTPCSSSTHSPRPTSWRWNGRASIRCPTAWACRWRTQW